MRSSTHIFSYKIVIKLITKQSEPHLLHLVVKQNIFTENKMTMKFNTKIPYFSVTNPLLNTFAWLKAGYKPFQCEIQLLTVLIVPQLFAKWQHFNRELREKQQTI